ncbi:MAG: hypothetical protein ACYTG0_40365 [Planctomycetota bacterium]
MKGESPGVARILGQLALVFVGVLLALAADDWRQGREEAAFGAAALGAILADLHADSAALQGLVDSYAVDDASGARLLANIDNPGFPRDSVEAYLRAWSCPLSVDSSSFEIQAAEARLLS